MTKKGIKSITLLAIVFIIFIFIFHFISGKKTFPKVKAK